MVQESVNQSKPRNDKPLRVQESVDQIEPRNDEPLTVQESVDQSELGNIKIQGFELYRS